MGVGDPVNTILDACSKAMLARARALHKNHTQPLPVAIPTSGVGLLGTLIDQLLQEVIIDSLPWRHRKVVRRPVVVQPSQFNQAFPRSVDATAVSATPGSPYDLARKKAKFTYPACTGCYSHISSGAKERTSSPVSNSLLSLPVLAQP